MPGTENHDIPGVGILRFEKISKLSSAGHAHVACEIPSGEIGLGAFVFQHRFTLLDRFGLHLPAAHSAELDSVHRHDGFRAWVLWNMAAPRNKSYHHEGNGSIFEFTGFLEKGEHKITHAFSQCENFSGYSTRSICSCVAGSSNFG